MTTNNAINNLPNSGIYQQAYWVSQFTGSDSNAGTSINTPFQHVQHVMGIAGTTPTIIYVIDANNNNNENISTTSAGQTIFIVANGTSFQGTITQAANDQLIIDGFAYIDSYTNNSSSPTYLTGNNLNITTTSTASNFINVGQYAGFHTGGGTLFVNCNELNSITCDGSITSYIDAPFSQNISNAGTMNLHTLIPPASCIVSNTGTIIGFVGGTILGISGVGPSTASVPAFTWPNTDGTTGQVPTTNGAGVVSWATGGGGSSHTYAQAFWVDLIGGSNSNAGTSIDTPFLTVQHAITAAGTPPTQIYVVNGVNNTETITVAAFQNIYIEFPGGGFSGSFTNNATLIANTQYFANLINVHGAYAVLNTNQALIMTDAGTTYAYGVTTLSYTGTGATAFIDVMQPNGGGSPAAVSMTGGTLSLSSNGPSVALTLNSSPTVYLNSNYPVTISGDGTATIIGSAGTTLFGSVINFAGVNGTIGYHLPTTDGTNGQVPTTNGSGVVTWQNGGGSPFAYSDTLWVAQQNGNDSNSGASIDLPLLTAQHSINTAGTTQTMIYLVDFSGNSETLSTTNAGQSLYMFAPGTAFQASLTVATTDVLTLNCNAHSNTINNDGSLFINANSINAVNNANTGTLYATSQVFGTYTSSGTISVGYISTLSGGTFNATGGTLSITCGSAFNLDANSSPVVNVLSAGHMTVTGDGTATITGIAGNTLYGGGSTFNIANGAGVVGYSIPTTDGTNGQALVTNGSHVASWVSIPGLFNYDNALWAATNGNNSNSGTNINSPFITIQHSVTTASVTPTMISVPGYYQNSETITTTGAGQLLAFDTSGTEYGGTFTCALNDQIVMNAFTMNTVDHNDDHYDSYYHVDNMTQLNIASNGGAFAIASIIGGVNVGANALATISAPGGVTELITGTGSVTSASIGYGTGVSAPAVSGTGAVYGRVGCVDYGPMADSGGGFYTASIDVTADYSTLQFVGHVNVIVAAITNPINLAQYKVTNIYINSGGTNFIGGDRDLALTDGTTVYTVIPSASLLTLANAGWGSVAVPFPASAAINTLTQANSNLVLQYSGGTTNYTNGVVSITVEYARVV